MLFKKCPSCGFEWPAREDFLADPALTIVGYQVNFIHLHKGLFLFNHRCKSTIALEANKFEDLYDGPIFIERSTGQDDCPGYCLHRDNLETCPAKCECSYVREIIRLIKGWEKGGEGR